MQQSTVKRAPLAFFSTDARTLARNLIGATLMRRLADGTTLGGVIVETEAYLGVEDRCCHSYGNRRTASNDSMFQRPGTAYVYFTYGMHHCFNVVCGTPADPGEPVAVLIRALLPVEGLDRMFRLRGRAATRPRDLCSGPGKLCRAMSMDRELDGHDMTTSPELWIRPPQSGATRLVRSPRIGVSGGGGGRGGEAAADPKRAKWAAARLRWYDAEHADWVSVRASPERIERWNLTV